MPLPIPIIDPLTGGFTTATRKQIKELLEAYYLSRFIKFPPLVFPTPIPPFPISDIGDPDPQTNKDAFQTSLLGELLIHALGSPDTQQNNTSVVNAIKREKLDVEILKEITCQLKDGIKNLEKELVILEQRDK